MDRLQHSHEQASSKGEFDRSISDKAGKKYDLYKRSKENSHIPFDIQYDLYDPESKAKIGRIAIWLEHFWEPKLPANFLDIPRDLTNLPIYRSEVTINPGWEGKGLGGELSNVLREWMSSQSEDIVHLIFFTKDGLDRLSESFMKSGYSVTNVTNEFLASQFTGAEQKVWIYKHYAPASESKKSESNSLQN